MIQMHRPEVGDGLKPPALLAFDATQPGALPVFPTFHRNLGGVEIALLLAMLITLPLAFNFPICRFEIGGINCLVFLNKPLSKRTNLVSPQEKSSKCQYAYMGRTKFHTGNAIKYINIHAT